MAGAALALGLVGALTGVASLTWNIVSYKMTAGRAAVELRCGFVGGGSYASIPISGTAAAPTGDLTDPVLVVQVTNTGRLPISVTSAAIGISPTVQVGTLHDVRNPTMPVRL